MQVIFHLPTGLTVLVDLFAPVPAIGETILLHTAREWNGETTIDTIAYTVADVSHHIDAMELKRHAEVAGGTTIHYSGARGTLHVHLKPKGISTDNRETPEEPSTERVP